MLKGYPSLSASSDSAIFERERLRSISDADQRTRRTWDGFQARDTVKLLKTRVAEGGPSTGGFEENVVKAKSQGGRGGFNKGTKVPDISVPGDLLLEKWGKKKGYRYCYKAYR
jgi:hypothetical protein